MLGWKFFYKETKQQKLPVIVNNEPIKAKGTTQKPSKPKTISTPSVIQDPIQQVKTYAGSNPDGSVNIDEFGHILVDKDLKQLFDYFLSATGELSFQEIRNLLILYSEKNLNKEQVAELLNLLNRYHNYLNSAEEFSNNLSLDLTQQQILELLSEFRINTLGEEMAAQFFIEEEGYIRFVYADKNDGIDEENEQQLEWLQAENNATSFQDTVIENRDFSQSNDISDDDIHNQRVEQYGEDATLRLEQLDEQRNQWQQTVDEYMNAREQIENNQTQFTLNQLHLNYSEEDTRRLQALWRLKQ